MQFMKILFIGLVAGSTIWVDELQLSYPANAEELRADEVSIYPNPFGEELRVQVPSNDQAMVRIYAVSGAKVLEATINGSQAIPTSQLERGMYLVEVSYGDEHRVRKLLRQ